LLCSQRAPWPSYPPLGASRCRGGWYWPWRPWGWSTVMEPPRSALPRTSLEKASRHGTPQRRKALNTTAACWEHVVRHIAGTVRMIGREIPPSWRTWLTGLTQCSTETLAPRQHRDDGQRSAPRWGPSPHCRQRDSTEPIGSGSPHLRIWAPRPSSSAVGERGGACVNPSQGSATLCWKTCQSRASATSIRAHRIEGSEGGVPLWYHPASTLSTPHRHALGDSHPLRLPMSSEDFRRLRTAHASWGRLSRGRVCGPVPRAPSRGNCFHINHKK